MVVGGLCIGGARAEARKGLPAFGGTDADVAKPGMIEIELQPAGTPSSRSGVVHNLFTKREAA